MANTRQFKLSIDPLKITGSHSNFPVYANRSNNPDEFHDPSSDNRSAGNDVRLYDEDGLTELPREIIDFSLDSSTGAGDGTYQACYLKPFLDSADPDPFLLISYGDRTLSDYAATDTYGRNAVWVDEEAALHLNDSGLVDSTGNGHDGTATGTISFTSANHPFGGQWATFDTNVAEYITLGSSGDMLDNVAGASIRAMVYVDHDHTGGIVSNRRNTAPTNWFQINRRASGPSGYQAVIHDGTGEALVSSANATGVAHLALVWDTSGIELFVDGSSNGTDTMAGDGLFSAVDDIVIGHYYILAGTGYDLEGNAGEILIRTSKLTSGRIATENENLNNISTFSTPGTPYDIGGSVTGSLAVTLDDNIISATGQVGEAATGSLAVTLDDNIISATGQVGEVATGSLAVTLDDNIISATGLHGEVATGSLAVTLDDNIISATGQVGNFISGSLAVTLDDNIISATGQIGEAATGSLAVTLDDNIISATGLHGEAVIGSLAVILDDNIISATGQVGEAATGSLAVTLKHNTLLAYALTGEAVIGSLDVTLNDNIISAIGQVGIISAGENDISLSLSLDIININISSTLNIDNINKIGDL